MCAVLGPPWQGGLNWRGLEPFDGVLEVDPLYSSSSFKLWLFFFFLYPQASRASLDRISGLTEVAGWL